MGISTNTAKQKDPHANKFHFITSLSIRQLASNKTMSFCLHSAPNNSRISWIQNRRRLALKNSRFASVAIRAITGNSTMANLVRVAAVQMTSVNDLAANFATCSRLVKVSFRFSIILLCFSVVVIFFLMLAFGCGETAVK